jgi:lipid A 3-O-deacylase
MPAARHSSSRAAVTAALVLLAGCTATIDNDDSGFLGDGNDRWYTAGARFERPAVADDDSLAGVVDGVVREVAGVLPLTGDEAGFASASGVLGLEMYTPEDTGLTGPILDDRPYAGWVYAGVVSRETWLDADPLRRRDSEAAVELDVGWVGPATQVDELQTTFHDLFGMNEPEGWGNQLDDEPGLVLRGALRHRWGYDELGAGVAWELVPRVDAALGNIDTHAGLGGGARLGFNLSRALDPLVGDPLMNARPGGDRPASVFLFADVDGRYVAHNLFLEGNTFHDSQSVDAEDFVGELALGLGWEVGPWRIAWARHERSDEFVGQHEGQGYGSLTVSWTPGP